MFDFLLTIDAKSKKRSEKVKSKKLFNSEEESTEFALGLKLFTEVMLRNKKHPLFEDLRPHIVDFMKKLKSS